MSDNEPTMTTAPDTAAPDTAVPEAAAPRARQNPVAAALALVYVTLLVLTGVSILGAGVLFEWRPYLVTSGSMVPAMSPGDVIVVDPAAPGEGFNPPTTITFRDPARGLVTHRIIKTEQAPNGELRYTTKGDANPSPESGTVPQSALVGSVRYVVRDVGMPLQWAQQERWGPLGAWALLTLLAIWLAAGFLNPRRGGAA